MKYEKLKLKIRNKKHDVRYKIFSLFSYLSILIILFPISYFVSPKTSHAGFLSRPPTSLGLVGYWQMDEGVGNRAGDFSGSGNSGTITGATWTNGKHGKALSFNGSSDYVDATNIDLTGTFSMSFWYKTSSNNQIGVIIGEDSGDTSSTPKFGIVNNQIFVRIVSLGSADNSIAAPVAGQWHHIVLTRGSDNKVDLYLNGSSANRLFANTAQSGTYTVDLLGANGIGASQKFNGSLDDVRIYNRALTATEISKLYSSGQTALKKVSEQGLVGYWAMNEGQGVNAGDSSGKNNTGTISGTANWVAGKKGKALSFNGTNNKIGINSSTLYSTSNFTITAWIKLNAAFNSSSSAAGIYHLADMPSTDDLVFRLAGAGQVYGFGGTMGALCLAAYGSGFQNACSSQTSWDANTWYHVAATMDTVSAGQVVYVNGVSAGTNSNKVRGSSKAVNARLGALWNSTDGNFFPGIIDDVRIYNRALSAAEIQSIYKQNETMVNAPQNDKLTNGLIGLWSFNGKDVSGTTAYDRSGQGNNGNITGGAKLDAGKVGQALSFDGVDDYVVSTNVVNVAKASVSAWVKISSLPAQKGLVAGFINGISNNAHDKDLYIGTDGKVYFYVYDNTQRTTSAPASPIPLNTWVHTVGTADGTNAKAYLNGVEVGTVVAGNTWTNYTVPNIFVSGTTGSPNVGGGYMNQQVDEVRIYNRALSADEVKQLYRMGQ